MNPLTTFSSKLSRVLFAAGLASILFAATAPAVHAQSSPSYSPISVSVEGNLPYSKSKVINVTAPDGITGPVAIGFDVSPTIYSGTREAAISYVKVSAARAFTGPGDVVPVTITFTAPASLPIPPGSSADFTYQIYTTGWRIPVTDRGFGLGAVMTAPPPTSSGIPTIGISAPADLSTITLDAGLLPALVPLNFRATTAGSQTINAVAASLSGPGLTGSPVALNAPGAGVQVFDAVGSLRIAADGDYSVEATASNGNGTASATTRFKVVVTGGPKPVPAISEPAPGSIFTYVYGEAPAKVPVNISASAPAGGVVQSWSATLTTPTQVSTSSPRITGGSLGTSAVSGTIPLDLTEEGQYSLSVTAANQFGSDTTSSNFQLNVVFKPSIVTQPAGATVLAGGNLNLTVVAAGTGPLSYQWKKGTANIGANSASLPLSAVSPADAGDYTVVVSNLYGSVTSSVATVSIQTLPTVTNPVSQTVPALSNVTFSVEGNGNPTPTLQWFKGSVGQGIAIPGATNPTLSLNGVTTLDAGNYYAVATNSRGSVSSQSALLSVTLLTATVTVPSLTTTYDGSSKSVSATVSPAGLSLSTTYNGVASAPTNAGTYSVVATVVGSNVYQGSSAGTLKVEKANQSIQNLNVPAAATVGDAPVTLAATATSGLPVSYATSDSAVAGLAGNQLSFHAVGQAAITAIQPGNDNYYAAGSVQAPVTVSARSKVSPVITWPSPADITVGTPLSATQLNAVAKDPTTQAVISGSYAYTPDSGTQLAVGPGQSLAVTFTPLDSTKYNVISATNSINVIAAPAAGCGTVIVNHAPKLNGQGGIDGSLQMLLPESVSLNGQAWISEKFLVPGRPSVVKNGNPTIGSTVNDTGVYAPYSITLNGQALIGSLVNNTLPVAMPVVNAGPATTNVRDVKLTKSNDSAGSFSTIRDLTIDGSSIEVALPAGTYRDVTVSGNKSVLILGDATSTATKTYNLRNLKMTGNSELRVVGPVELIVDGDAVFNGNVGNPTKPAWLTVKIASGGLTLDGKLDFYGNVVAPKGTVTINGLGTLHGGLVADSLILNGQGLVDACGCQN